jgi:PadR family transcriptional regulator PadR
MVALVEPALLTLIREEQRHGYSLVSDLEELGLKTIHPSVVYRTLKKMEELAWIQSEWDTETVQGPPRRIFSLTAEGENALQAWQEELDRANESIAHIKARFAP